MIPHQITVSNFLSYGSAPQTISFEGYSLICLSGRNGHGKSALLDAMTWALWGQARKTVSTPKPDEGLIRLGAKSMMVMFEFYVGGKLYRARRECTMRQGNKPYLTLDIGIYDEEAQQFHSMTDKTIRKSQEVINRIVGLEYDTYVNSAYLRQGNANEFSQKAPKERKKILTAILGIDMYDALQTRALERAREHALQATILHELITHDEAELAAYPALREEQKQLSLDISVLGALQQEKETERSRLQHNSAALAARLTEYGERISAWQQQKQVLLQARSEWFAAAERYRRDRVSLVNVGTRHEVMDVLQSLRHKEMEQRRQHKEVLVLQQQIMSVEKQLFAREQVVMREIAGAGHDLLQKKHAATVASGQSATTEKQLRIQREQLLAERAVLADQKEAAARIIAAHAAEIAQAADFKKRFEKRKTFYTTYVPRMRWLHEQQQELLRKVEMVHDESSSCPLCDQVLSAKRKQFLHEKLQKNLSIVTHQYARLVKVLERLKKILVDDHKVLQDHELVAQKVQSACNQQEIVSAREAHVQIRLLSVEDALAKAMEESAGLGQLVARIETQVAAHEAESQTILQHDSLLAAYRLELQQLSGKVASCLYNEVQHTALEHEIARVDLLRLRIEEAEAQRELLGAARQQLLRDRKSLHEKQAHLAKEEKLLAGCEELKTQYDQCLAALARVAQECQEYTHQKDGLLQRHGQLAAMQSRLEERSRTLSLRRSEVTALENKQHDCITLAQAWSKNGVQALLIEQAIPEIEHEANMLLGRLSNNQAQVFIESLRDLKRGGVRETLDIKIADVMGVRPYEMFSGGEAFRIDFALRIALSKLLARRAGAALQVLIIDEGFGSQDEEGLGRLMDSLYAVQDDFAKIIVVTHLPAFKENFPVHFVVEKGSMGSVVTVEERG